MPLSMEMLIKSYQERANILKIEIAERSPILS